MNTKNTVFSRLFDEKLRLLWTELIKKKYNNEHTKISIQQTF
jgi:hypothetical protein